MLDLDIDPSPSASTAMIALFLVLNYFSQFQVFNLKNKAYGLDYTVESREYSMDAIGKVIFPAIVHVCILSPTCAGHSTAQRSVRHINRPELTFTQPRHS